MKVQIAYRSCIEVDGAQRPVGEALCQMLRGISEYSTSGPMGQCIYIYMYSWHTCTVLGTIQCMQVHGLL